MAPHDPLFKRLLQTFFRDFLELVAPEIAARLDLSAPVFLDKEFSSVGPPEASRVVDLLARIPLRRDKSRALLVHVEIEARASRGIGERLQSYQNWIKTRHAGQIVSVVLFLRGGRGGVGEQRLAEELSGPGLSGFSYLSFGLEKCPAAVYLRRPEPLAWALAALMDRGPLSRAQLKISCLLRVAEASLNDLERFVLVSCIENYLQLTAPGEAEEFASLSASRHWRTRNVSTSLITWTDRILWEGERQGARMVLLGVLEQRFGPLPEKVRQRIEKIRSVERLAVIAQKAVTAKSLKSLRLG
jgi:hypothetical protein